MRPPGPVPGSRVTLEVAVPGSAPVGLGATEASELIARLWEVSATQGAVVAIGRLSHSLLEEAPVHTIELSDPEARAVRVALQADGELPAGLSSLLHAVSSVAS